MTDYPSWWEFVLLALAAFRIFRLLAEDTILDRPRRYLLRLGKDWQPGMTKAKEQEVIPANYRAKWAAFLTCPWCAGFWIVVLWYVAWELWPERTLFVAALFALSAVVGLVAKNLDQEE